MTRLERKRVGRLSVAWARWQRTSRDLGYVRRRRLRRERRLYGERPESRSKAVRRHVRLMEWLSRPDWQARELGGSAPRRHAIESLARFNAMRKLFEVPS